MFRIGSITFLLTMAAAPAPAVDLTPVCAGFVGKWHVVDDASLSEDKKSWKQDLSDAHWHVTSIAPERCRFFTAKGDVDFDVDTSDGNYDVIEYDKGKAQPIESYKVISIAADGVNDWKLITAIPHRPTSTHYSRMIITMTGDVLTLEIANAEKPDGDFVPREITVHRRDP